MTVGSTYVLLIIQIYYMSPVLKPVQKMFQSGPEIQLLASKTTFQKMLALVRPAGIMYIIIWKYMYVYSSENSGFSKHVPAYELWLASALF